ncbi:hypothetical protein BH10PSE17_BH10PSE17_18160 [soil metagenome]
MSAASPRRHLLRFIAVGSVGFIVDACVLTAALKLTTLHPMAARVISFSCASAVTWWLNRRFTFDSRTAGRSAAREYSRYLAVQSVGALTNFGIFSLMIALYPTWIEWPVLPLAFGSAGGLLVNFFGSKLWAFRPG